VRWSNNNALAKVIATRKTVISRVRKPLGDLRILAQEGGASTRLPSPLGTCQESMWSSCCADESPTRASSRSEKCKWKQDFSFGGRDLAKWIGVVYGRGRFDLQTSFSAATKFDRDPVAVPPTFNPDVKLRAKMKMLQDRKERLKDT
jgi:hypothetical protein